MKPFVYSALFLFAFGCSNGSNQNDGGTKSDSTKFAIAASDIQANPLKEVYFGETHIHTSSSMDAFIGSNRVTPEDAYRFAMGESIMINGSMHKLKAPLDFCAISDHAEFLGETYTLMTPGSPGYDDSIAVQMRTVDSYDKALQLFTKYVIMPARSGAANKHPAFYQGEASTHSGWRKNFEATEKYNRPGKFTTLHAFEWTASYNAGNLHRNIIFRDTIVPYVPFSSNESNDPEKLWQWMQEQISKGSKLLAIPHNSNASKGYMFPDDTTLAGKKVSKEYSTIRQNMEPLIEIMQIKGNSEVHPSFWSNDEMANFENANTIQNYSGRKFEKRNFVRYGLEKGLAYQEDFGVNPFKYGFVGGSDNHNGAPGDVDEDNYTVGSHGWGDRTAQDRAKNEIDGWAMAFDINPGSLTGVWAPSNTRENIWDAMKAKETFATSGPRIKVRFFAGYDYADAYANYNDLVKDGYAKGVPMGGDLPFDNSKKPKFIVWATKDPNGANLDRIQIIKGWIENGQMKEKIYNVAVSDGRVIKADGSVDKLDAPIDLKTGAYKTDKGSVELQAVWTDPAFDSKQSAFYYVRVIEIPTARWTFFDELRENVKYPDNVPKSIQERAWSSPIWFTPKNNSHTKE